MAKTQHGSNDAGMVAAIDVDLSGLMHLLGHVEDALEDGLDHGALRLEKRMKQRIIMVDFIDTSETLNSVELQEKTRLTRVIGPGTDYAIHGEFGTRHMAARPFARPALRDEEKTITEATLEMVMKAARMKGLL